MSWTVEQPGVTLAAFVKAQAEVPNSVAKRHIESGKVFVDGTCVTKVDHRLSAGQEVELRMAAPKPFEAAPAIPTSSS